MTQPMKSNYDLKIKKRIQLVHIAAQELGLVDKGPGSRVQGPGSVPDDDYHRILTRWNRQGTRQPVTSSLQMNYGQLGELLEFFEGLGFKLKKTGSGVQGPGAMKSSEPSAAPREKKGSWKKYESSIEGLRQEICDLAKARWGDDFERSLNALCQRFGIRHWKWLDVAHGKEIKNAILRMNAADHAPETHPHPGPLPEGEGFPDKNSSLDEVPF